MRKTELIAELNKIKGNPEILLWNGYVGDYQYVAKLVLVCSVMRHRNAHKVELT